MGWGGIHCFEESTRRDNYWLRQAGHRHEDDRIRFEIVRTILMINMLMMITMRIVVMDGDFSSHKSMLTVGQQTHKLNLQRAGHTKGHLT